MQGFKPGRNRPFVDISYWSVLKVTTWWTQEILLTIVNTLAGDAYSFINGHLINVNNTLLVAKKKVLF